MLRPARTVEPRIRRGIGLVEVITALVLVSVGLLAIAGSSALLMRRAAERDVARRATRSAALRIALLSSAGCAGARTGTAGDSPRGVTERWVTTAVGPAEYLDVAVAWREGGARRQLVVRSAILC